MSFRLKTILGVAIIEAAILAILVVSIMTYLYDSNEQQLRRYAELTTATFAAMTKDSVLGMDLARLESFADELITNPGIVYARVRDDTGRVLAAAGPADVLRRSFQADGNLDSVDDELFDVVGQIFVDDVSFGQVEVGIEIGHLREMFSQAWRWSTGIALGEMVLVALFSLALGTYLLRQLAQMTEGAERLRQGEWGYQILVRGDDELATTSRAFNSLSMQLCEERRQQQKYARELLAAKQASEEATKAKSEFLAKISREIRAPTNAVIGMTGSLKQTRLNPEQTVYVETIHQSGESLLALVNDIQDFSKIEAGKLDIEEVDFDLQALMQDVASPLAAAARDKGLGFVCETVPGTPIYLRGDAGRLQQILSILVENAIKFSRAGEVAMRVSAVESTAEDVTVRFVVRDTGIGIPEDKHDWSVRTFSQFDASTTRRYGGTGLSLSVCKLLTEMMGGELGGQSKEGEWSEFWFTAKCNLQADKPLESVRDTNATKGARILLVDSDASRMVAM